MYRRLGSESAQLDPATLAVVAGRPAGAGEPLNQPPVFASAFASGEGLGYARLTNPTWEAFERALGELEHGSAVAFGSGMAAATAILDGLAVGARVVVARTSYVELRNLLAERAARGMLEMVEVDSVDTDAVIAALETADLLWLDALANPALDVAELDRILPAARRACTKSVVDSTLATPVLLCPLQLGADFVLHSATKYIGGHSDLVLGAAVARDPRAADELRRRRTATGAVPGTMETWLALRGMRTMALRLERGAQTAAVIAERLAVDDSVDRVRYPGLAADPTHATATRLLRDYGAVISFEVADAARADAICAAVEVITHATSLGGVETLIERQSRWHAEPAVPEGLLRISVGCEHPEDLWRDLDRALGAN